MKVVARWWSVVTSSCCAKAVKEISREKMNVIFFIE
jgi:hypothetical protein